MHEFNYVGVLAFSVKIAMLEDVYYFMRNPQTNDKPDTFTQYLALHDKIHNSNISDVYIRGLVMHKEGTMLSSVLAPEVKDEILYQLNKLEVLLGEFEQNEPKNL